MNSEQCTVIRGYFWIDKYIYTCESVEVFGGNNFKLYSLSRHIWRVFAALSMIKWKLLSGYSPAVMLHLEVLSIPACCMTNFTGLQGGNSLSVPGTRIWVWRTAEMAKITKPGVVSCSYQHKSRNCSLHQTGTATTTLPRDRLCGGIAQLKSTQISVDQPISQFNGFISNSLSFATLFLLAYCFLEQADPV